MILKMYCVFDSKVGAYLPPQYFRTNAEALRAFASAVAEKDTNFCKYPADYTLFEIGAFHDDNAAVNMLSAPKSLAVAIEFVHQDQMDMVSGAKLGAVSNA